MAKCLEIKNRKRVATHKLLKNESKSSKAGTKGFGTTSNVRDLKEIQDNSHKASGCTKLRKVRYGTPKVEAVSTKHLNVLPRKEKKAAKKLLLAA